MKDFREAFPTPDRLNDEGCQRLASAIVLQAAEDYYEYLKDAWRHRGKVDLAPAADLRAFVYGPMFARITDISPEEFYRIVKEWWRRGRSLPAYIHKWKTRMEGPELMPRSAPEHYEPQMLTNLLSDYRFKANWRPEDRPERVERGIEGSRK